MEAEAADVLGVVLGGGSGCTRGRSRWLRIWTLAHRGPDPRLRGSRSGQPGQRSRAPRGARGQGGGGHLRQHIEQVALLLQGHLDAEVGGLEQAPGPRGTRPEHGHPTRDDRDLRCLVGLFAGFRHESVTGLVIGDDLLLLRADDPGSTLEPAQLSSPELRRAGSVPSLIDRRPGERASQRPP